MTTKIKIKIKTPSEISSSGKPFQTTILIKSQRGLDLLAWSRKNKYDISSVIDKLLEVYGPELLSMKGVDGMLKIKYFAWPAKRGVRP